MVRHEATDNQSGTSVESIKTIVDQMLGYLEEKYKDDLSKLVSQRLKGARAIGEFKNWLKRGNFTSNLTWIEQLKADKVDQEILKEAAWDCLQVVVLAYLPGPRYFQGAYIYSKLREPQNLKQIKREFKVPHLSGAVGWMSAYLLNSQDSYVVLHDAQLDLRGRVAVADLRLGNRAVLGFPVSINAGNKDLASISGFMFFSHPVPGIFPQPSDKNKLSEAFEEIRKLHESALASAIENYIFRRYGNSALSEQGKSKEAVRTPLLTLSSDDPTGFLVSLLFESNPTGALSAECEVNEDVFLETTAWHLRVASTYPEKWAPGFVQHMRRLGDLIEGPNIHRRAPLVWYSRGGASSVQRLYPPESISEEDIDYLAASLNRPAQMTSSNEQSIARTEERPRVIKEAITDIMALYGARSGPANQADLVVPIYIEQEGSTSSLGFFRINCDASAIRDDTKMESAFHNLWRVLKKIHDEINPEIARLILALEEELYKPATSYSEHPDKITKSEEVQHVKLWVDTSHLINEWLARQMHILVWQLTSTEEFHITPKEFNLQEDLIRFALRSLSIPVNEELTRAFISCSNKYKDLLTVRPSQIVDQLPEITFVSFWSRMKLPVLNNIANLVAGKESPAEEEFGSLLLDDPGLLRMLTILAPMLDPGETIDLGPSRNPLKTDKWKDIDFGVPTDTDIAELKVRRSPEDTDLALDIVWKRGSQHNIRLRWDYTNPAAQTRNLSGLAISNAPRTVARRLGENILAGLEMKLQPDRLAKLKDSNFKNEYWNISDFVVSTDHEGLDRQLGFFERVMLYDESDSPGWRILPIPVSSHPLVFVAALCDKKIKRPAVLAFRDFALANARAFYIAREYDAQREAVEEYARNLSAIAHGYKGPLRQLGFAVGDAKKLILENSKWQVVDAEMEKLEKMVNSAKQLATDAISYAWRNATPILIETQSWRDMSDQIHQVIQALDRPRSPKVEFDQRIFGEHVKVDSSPQLLRHLLSKLIDNGLEHGDDDPNHSTPFKVFLRPEIKERRFILRISNFVFSENLAEVSDRIRVCLTNGFPYVTEEGPNFSGRNRGFGLIEAYNCCNLLGIDPEVDADEEVSQLVISLRMPLKG
jgi:hypothetical protein